MKNFLNPLSNLISEDIIFDHAGFYHPLIEIINFKWWSFLTVFSPSLYYLHGYKQRRVHVKSDRSAETSLAKMSQPSTTSLKLAKKKKTRTRCEICSKLTIKTQKLGHWCRSGVFIGTFEYIAQLVLMFSLLTLIR